MNNHKNKKTSKIHQLAKLMIEGATISFVDWSALKSGCFQKQIKFYANVNFYTIDIFSLFAR